MTKRIISWTELLQRMAPYDEPGLRVYGVPRGGMICTAFLRNATAVFHPEDSDIILDDIIDSGATAERYRARFPAAPFVALFDKTGKDKDVGWLIFPWETGVEDSAEDSVTRMLEFVGEDCSREGLRDTPARVVRSWGELYGGYGQDPAEVFRTFEDGACDEMVVLRDIEFFSTCEHHLLPFFGKAHIAYIPDGLVIGVSKLARLLEIFSRRLQIQERIGSQVTNELMARLKPKGAACIIEAQHLCMKSRGVNKQDSVMVTSSLRGVFKDDVSTRSELLGLIRR